MLSWRSGYSHHSWAVKCHPYSLPPWELRHSFSSFWECRQLRAHIWVPASGDCPQPSARELPYSMLYHLSPEQQHTFNDWSIWGHKGPYPIQDNSLGPVGPTGTFVVTAPKPRFSNCLVWLCSLFRTCWTQEPSPIKFLQANPYLVLGKPGLQQSPDRDYAMCTCMSL